MNRGNMVKKYCMENKEPVQALCPRLVQVWRDSKGTKIYWDSMTGLRCDEYHIGGDLKRISVSVRTEYDGLYVEYIKELDALEISHIYIDGGRGADGEKKYWSYVCDGDRMFIFKDTTDAYYGSGTIVTSDKKYYNEAVYNHITNALSGLCNLDAIHDEVSAFTGKSIVAYGVWQFRDWYQKDFMSRKANKNASVLDYDLKDEEFTQAKDRLNCITFTQLDDDWAVLRVYNKFIYVREAMRVFVNRKGKVVTVIRRYHDQNWKISNRKWYGYGSTELINPEKFMQWEPLKYVLPVMKNPTISDIINILRHPVIEQLIKAGYPEVAKRINAGDQVAANLKAYFGVEREKKKPLFKLLGVNKEIMKRLEESLSNPYADNTNNFVMQLKNLYGRFDISDLSKQTIDILYAGYKQCDDFDTIFTGRNRCRCYRSKEDYLYHPYTDENRALIIKLCKAEQNNEGIINLYRDTIGLYYNINERPALNIRDYKNYADLQRMHDALLDIQLQEEAEHRARYNEQEKQKLERIQKDFDKLQNERIAKYEYEDDTYCIRVPRDLLEIKKEGIELSHCVGGYTERHATGRTNILFLRRKADEAHSFYTVEINNGHVIQIHGKYNRWLGNDPEAIPFMYRYLTQLGVSFDKKLLLNLGTGYSASSENLDESYLVQAA